MDELLDFFATGHRRVNLAGLQGSSTAFVAALLAGKIKRTLLYITPSERLAELAVQDITLFTHLPVIHYPGFDIPPYTPLSPDQSTVAERLNTLYRLLTDDTPSIIVASSESLLRRVMPKSTLGALAELIINGEDLELDGLSRRLTDMGYEHLSLVQAIGDFSVRGGIIDIFPPGYESPVRLDMFGDTVESLRTFDPISQRSIHEIDEAVILPASNILFPRIESKKFIRIQSRFQSAAKRLDWPLAEVDALLDKISSGRRFPGIEFFLPLFYSDDNNCPCPLQYLPDNTLVWFSDTAETNRSMQLAWERILANYNESVSSRVPALEPDTVFISPDDLVKEIESFTQVHVIDFPEKNNNEIKTFNFVSQNHLLLKQEIDLQRKQQGILQPLAQILKEWLSREEQIAIACRSPRHGNHLAELLSHHQIPIISQDTPLELKLFKQPETSPKVMLLGQPLSAGFDLRLPPNLHIHVLSENELFGERRLGPRKKRKPAREDVIRFDELKRGDIVVHREHGLGAYQGLVTLTLKNITNDFLEIHYQGEDKLYVPVDRLNSISSYKGISDKRPKLDKLGAKTWLRTKKKVKESVWQVAQDLLKVYAKREMQKGFVLSQPGVLFHELEESFSFDETAGQQKAINEVLGDLTSEKIMDRLICGDVGYGKTEVAVRAAFKTIEDGFQVAMLVPTTVLAEQHARTFQERFAGFPVIVESINRFRSRTEQKKILENLKDGRIDMLIGTHRLLSKDVQFKKIGLLIVDEEHRFGVSHKEKIKRLRAEVNVLTLSATPIPRTLQLSLLGVRDLSVINTPPEQRRAVKTFVARYDELVIKEAIIRELQRGGQTFLVHNRVQSIGEMAQKIKKLAPHARIAVAHGQMPAKQLEEIMVLFVKKEIDVLVCTTIIESGLDIASANTIVITRADRLGLAEIHQLRGRVGRSSEQSYAYLLVPSLDGLAKEAKDRLRALLDYSELGGGFKLAMSDLQIRGGGNILGVSQSGHIAAVGYDLYLELLQNTVSDLKRQTDKEKVVEKVDPEINLQVSAYIPEKYIIDSPQRYISYRKIAGLADFEQLADLKDELQDRYGPLPAETQNLFDIMGLKLKMKDIMIIRLEQGTDMLVFSFHEKTPVKPEKILSLIEKTKNNIRFTPDARLMVPLSSKLTHSPQAVLHAANEIINSLKAEAV
ncbi:MAG: transcription-repair coupling factor [Deltaproteobacteria bacterium]|jgi:transcription-repair coupling factor (superfamily II helicase)|nr:transcription-repair coupling factor [Deltaproteobacteria bacterium]